MATEESHARIAKQVDAAYKLLVEEDRETHPSVPPNYNYHVNHEWYEVRWVDTGNRNPAEYMFVELHLNKIMCYPHPAMKDIGERAKKLVTKEDPMCCVVLGWNGPPLDNGVYQITDIVKNMSAAGQKVIDHGPDNPPFGVEGHDPDRRSSIGPIFPIPEETEE